MSQFDPSGVTSRPRYFDAGLVVTRLFQFDFLTHKAIFGQPENVSSSATNRVPDEIKRSFKYSALLTLHGFVQKLLQLNLPSPSL